MHYIAQSLLALNHSACRLRWNPVNDDDLVGYHIYLSVGDTSHYERMTAIPIPDTEWVSPPLRTDRTYYFYITAIDRSENESVGSEVASFTLRDGLNDIDVIEVPLPSLCTIGGFTTIDHTIDPRWQRNFTTLFSIGEGH